MFKFIEHKTEKKTWSFAELSATVSYIQYNWYEGEKLTKYFEIKLL